MNLTYYGQSCFSVEVNGRKLLFDPFITYNPLAKDIDKKKIEADYIFLSHGHTDHFADAEELARQTGATCVAAAEIADWLGSKGIEKVHPLNHGGPVVFDFGKVRAVNAIHSSSFPDGSYAGNPLVLCLLLPKVIFIIREILPLPWICSLFRDGQHLNLRFYPSVEILRWMCLMLLQLQSLLIVILL